MDVCRSVSNTCKVCGSRLKYIPDTGKIEKLGVWVYSGIAVNSMFSRFDTIAEAVRAAVMRSNAEILLRGEVLEYGLIDLERAYYIDKDTKAVMIVDLNYTRKEM